MRVELAGCALVCVNAMSGLAIFVADAPDGQMEVQTLAPP